MSASAAFTDRVMVAGVFPLDGVTVRKLPPVLGAKATVNGALVPATLVTWTLCATGVDIDPACTLNVAVLMESEMAEVA